MIYGLLKRVVPLALALLGGPLMALELQVVGVVGNSGESGSSLIRTSVLRGGGAAVDSQGRIYSGGGDRILVLNRDGKLLWTTKLPQPDWVLQGAKFALSGRHLYFLAGKFLSMAGDSPWPNAEANLCRVETKPDAQVEIVATSQELGCSSWQLAAQPDGSKVYLGCSKASEFQISEIQPDDKRQFVFSHPFNSFSVDEAGRFYLSFDHGVGRFDKTGKPDPTFSFTPLPTLVGIPTAFQGLVLLTRDALWDAGPYGFIGRFTREMKQDPGTVVSWQHALRLVVQIVDGPGSDQYYVQSNDALYLTELREGQLRLLRRFGSLPAVKELLLTRDGYIVASDARPTGVLFFDFAGNDPAAAPVKVGYDGPDAQGALDYRGKLINYSRGPDGTLYSSSYTPDPFGDMTCQYNSTNSLRDVGAVVELGGYYFPIDRKTGKLLRAPSNDPLQFTELEFRPNSLASVGAKLLLIAESDTVRALSVATDGSVKDAWTLRPEQPFGKELHVATSGNLLLVSDTKRHRVLLFSFGDDIQKPPAFQFQLGETDHAGDDLRHFDSPTLLSINGGKALVYDSGNQRIVKLRLR